MQGRPALKSEFWRRVIATFNIDVVVSNRGAVAGVQAVDRQLGLLNRTVSSLQNAFVGLFAVQQIASFVTSIGRVAEGFNRLERSAQIAAGPSGAVAFALESVIDTAQRAGASLDTTSKVFQRFALATRASGVSQQEVAVITDTLVRGFAIFTGSASEANSAITQLSQAFSSGRLAGDEFRSVSENFPPLLQAISDVTGVAVSDLRDFAAQGSITSDVLLEAFGLLETQISSLEATINQTLEQSLNRLGNSFQLLVGEIDNVVGVIDLFRDGVISLTSALDNSRLLAFGGTVNETRAALLNALGAQEEYNASVENSSSVSNFFSLSLVRQQGLQDQVRAATANYTAALAQQNEATQQAADRTQLFEAAQISLIATVSQFNTIQQLSTQEALRQIDVGGDLTQSINAQIDARVSQIQVDEQAIAVQEQAVRLQENFNALLTTSAAEQRAALALDAQVSAELTRRNTLIEAQNALLEEQRQAIENVTRTFAAFLSLNTSELENALANLSTLGLGLSDTFTVAAAEIAEALGVTENEVVNATSGIFAVLNEFGIDVEDIFGRRAAQAIRLFGAVTSEEFSGVLAVLDGAVTKIGNFFGGGGESGGGGGGGGLGGLLSGITSLFGGAEDAVSSLEQQSFLTLTSFNSSIGDLQAASSDATGAVGGLGSAVGETGAALGLTTGQIVGASTALAGLAGGIAKVVGASEGAQLGSTIGTLLGGVIGGFATGGSPIGIGAGAAAGGGLGGFIGNLFGDAEAKAARELGKNVANEVLKGVSISSGELFSELSQDEASAALERINRVVGQLNDNLRGTAQEVETVFGTFRRESISQEAFLLALSKAPLTAAAEISDVFNLTVADVAAVFNTLPRELAGTFNLITENAGEIADILVDQFGLSRDAVVEVLKTLGVAADEAFGQIDDASRFLAASLAEEFGVNVTEVARLFDDLPPGIIENFSDIANNAEDIARRIAVSFGLTFDEALAVVQKFAGNAGLSLSDVGTSAQDVAAQISAGFEGTDQQLSSIFFNLARQGADAFEDIRVSADGTFRLVDEDAQTAIESIVARFGGGQADIQLILGLLAGNADISFGDILASGVFTFDNLDAASVEFVTNLLSSLGFSAEQITRFLFGVSDEGDEAFNAIEQSAAIALANVLTSFDLTEDEIVPILAAIVANADAAFSDVEGASGEALREILTQFGITEEQINFLLEQVGAGARSIFADIGAVGGDTAGGLEGVFAAALQFIIETFGVLENSASSELSQIGSVASSTGNIIRSSFAGAAAAAVGSLGQIRSSANSASVAIRSVPRAVGGAGGGEVQAFAQGGIITGPVALDGGGAGRAFQTGGVLDGLTNIFAGGGSVAPTSRLGIAGEAGVEAILPLDRINGRLGVSASLPDSLIAAIQGGNQGDGTTVIRENRVFILRNVSNDDLDRLEDQILDVDASVESRSEAVTSEILAQVLS